VVTHPSLRAQDEAKGQRDQARKDGEMRQRLADQAETGRAGTEAGSYLRLIDSCITQLKAQGPVTRVKKKRKKMRQRLVDQAEGGITGRAGAPIMAQT